jgi:uncharacterized protein with HEPN domain
MNRDELYVIHILECIDRINRFVEARGESLLGEEMAQDAVLRNLQTLAESTQHLSEEVKKALPGIRWGSIAGFRNVLFHGYLGVNMDRIWEIVEGDLPELEAALRNIAPEKR